VVDGANDNLSSCAAVAVLARRFARFRDDDIELVLGVTGGEEVRVHRIGPPDARALGSFPNGGGRPGTEALILHLTRPPAATNVGWVSDPTRPGRDGVPTYKDARTVHASYR
jgi:hypothetical protein